MKRLLFSLLVLPVLLPTLAAENPMGFREYTQKITAEFASPDEARRATAEFSRMPNGEELAFSCRWDDSNPRHEQMSALLKKHGLKGTFFLTGLDNSYYDKYGKKLLADGNHIGMHTMTHPFLPFLNPAAISAEIMLNRPELESQLDCTVNAMVLPFGYYSNGIDPAVPGMLRDALFRSGCYGAAEYVLPNKIYNCSGKQNILSCSLFDANDRSPTVKTFETNLAAALEKARKPGAEPHVTLGVHSWQSDAGLETLGYCFSQIRKNDWWFCTFNEYCAYRYEYLYGMVQKGAVNGNKAVFTVRRIVPADLGADVPVSLCFSQRPVNVRLDSTELACSEKGIFRLPHTTVYKLPQKVDYVHNPDNLPPAEGLGGSKKFPGLEFAVFCDPVSGKIQCRLYNLTGEKLDNIHLNIRLPLRWQRENAVSELKQLPQEHFRIWSFPLGKENCDPEYQEGDSVILAQCDFEQGGKTYRIYADTYVSGTKPSFKLASKLLSAGPFLKEKAPPELLVRLSDPQEKLNHFGEAGNEKWHLTKPRSGYNSYAAEIGPVSDNEFALSKKCCYPAPGMRVLALEFHLDHAETLKLNYNNLYYVQLYLNGLQLSDIRPEMFLTARQGKNRLLIVETRCYDPKKQMAFRLFSTQKNHPVQTLILPEL